MANAETDSISNAASAVLYDKSAGIDTFLLIFLIGARGFQSRMISGILSMETVLINDH